jgi:ComF family protein
LNRCVDLVQRCVPVSCVLCGALAGIDAICAPCAAALPKLPQPFCRVCALPLTSGEICGACMAAPPAYDAVTALYAYDFPVDALIQAYKYGGRLSFAPIFGRLLARAATSEVDLVVPMPLGPARLRERGFNQAHEIARRVGRLRGLRVVADACRKVTDTAPQAALPWKARARNVRGAFVSLADFTGLRVAIVDDVMTTGATVNELAKSVKRAGAAHVSVWVVARTLPKERPLAGAAPF